MLLQARLLHERLLADLTRVPTIPGVDLQMVFQVVLPAKQSPTHVAFKPLLFVRGAVQTKAQLAEKGTVADVTGHSPLSHVHFLLVLDDKAGEAEFLPANIAGWSWDAVCLF